jgi:hypothetical protein
MLKAWIQPQNPTKVFQNLQNKIINRLFKSLARDILLKQDSKLKTQKGQDPLCKLYAQLVDFRIFKIYPRQILLH